MKIIEDICTTHESFPNVVMTIGSFDGVHLGHQRILEKVVLDARADNGTAALLTMKPHPREFFTPEHAPNLLTSNTKKLQLLENVGIDVVFILNFGVEQANLQPLQFIDEIILKRCHAKEIVVGHDFCFGKDAMGDYSLLSKTCGDLGIKTSLIPPLYIRGERVSSTLIRECILQGDLDAVKNFLGRRYSIVGEVISGRGIGKSLGFPTANIKPYHNAVPAQGVYIAQAFIDDNPFQAAVNIGIAPTIRQEDLTIEAYLLDFAGDVVGKNIEIEFIRRIRPEQKYATYEELVSQINEDVEEVRRHFDFNKL